MTVLRRRARDDDGATAVEFGLILVPLLVIIFGLIQYGLYFYSAQTGSNTVNAAVRQLSVGNCATQDELEDYVNAQLGAASTGDATVTATWENPGATATDPPVAADRSTVEVGGTVELSISFPTMNMHFPFVPFLKDATVVREVQARVEDTTSQGCGA